MSSVTIFILLAIMVAFSSTQDADNKQPELKAVVAPSEGSKESRASVIQTSLSGNEAILLANQLQYIYNTVPTPIGRATTFRNFLQNRYPQYTNHVIISYSAVAVVQRYYIIIQVNGEYVFSFGV